MRLGAASPHYLSSLRHHLLVASRDTPAACCRRARSALAALHARRAVAAAAMPPIKDSIEVTALERQIFADLLGAAKEVSRGHMHRRHAPPPPCRHALAHRLLWLSRPGWAPRCAAPAGGCVTS